MQNRARVALAGAVIALLVALIGWLTFGHDPDVAPSRTGVAGAQGNAPAPAAGDLGIVPAAATVDGGAAGREQLPLGGPPTGVRGVVLDAKTGRPLGGIEVVAIKDEPSIEPLVARFRGLFQAGMFVETRAPRRELGRTVSNADGSFELLGLLPGRVFLDGRSDGWFVRTPGTARLAGGQIQDGIELRASPGGRVRGIVLGADGGPAAGRARQPATGAQLVPRPDHRSFSTAGSRPSLTQEGRFDLPGVPAGPATRSRRRRSRSRSKRFTASTCGPARSPR
jgi:hypothetical protein